LGLGISGGFMNSKLSTSAINQFMIDRKFPQTSLVTTTPSQNAFLLVGPSLRLGQRTQLIASVKGGMFFNQSGGLIIGQQGAVRPLYRFDAGTKSLFPGLNGSLSFSYPVGATSSLLLSTDFLHSSSSIQLYDPQQGIDIPVEQKRKMQTINAGITFIKTFGIKSPRDAASGQSSGKRERGSGLATGRRQYETVTDGNDNNRVLKTKTKSNQSNDRVHGDPHVDDGTSIIDPENKRVVKTKTKSNQSNDRSVSESCGPVTTKTTHPDGTVEEQTFSCPDDAVNYKLKIDGGMPNRISMNVTVPKQTQGATFGEKVNQGLHAAGSHLVSGKIVRNSAGGGAGGIVTNKTHSGGGAAAASYASTGMVVNNGPYMNLFAREAGSGMASGKRERGSGMATGRRQYQPLFFDGQTQGEVCNPCMGVVKNPLYEEKGQGHNPLFKSKQTTADNDCDGAAEGFDIYLIDRTTGASVASTKTNKCGEYWFANVPGGNYSVQVSGTFFSKKGYDYYQAQSNARTDIAGEVLMPDETWQHIMHNNNTPQTKAGISTSRSNIRTRNSITVASGDVNGDGTADYYRAIATYSDGTSKVIAEGSLSANASVIAIPVEETNQQKTGINTSRSNIKNFTITSADVNADGVADITVRGLFSDGTTKDITEYCDSKQQPGVMQISIAVADVDGDGMSDLIWSPRSNVGVNARTNNINVNELPTAIINTSRSNIKHLAVAIGDVDSDGISEILVGNDDDNGSTARPGSPIGGLSIKGGRNPGGDTARMRTSSMGEFEFKDLDPGNYTFIVEARYIISDETDIDLNDDDSDGDDTQNNTTLKTTTPKQTQGATFGEKVNAGLATSSFNSLLTTLTELDTQLQNDAASTKAGISTSRSNLRRVSNSIAAINTDLQNGNTAAAQLKMQTLQTQFMDLQASLTSLGAAYTSISNVLKTKHDTAKNSVGNIR
ncbi:MAG TPA: FG-GAP-like repeat-containing protein, partial [Lacibacter sp.]|nr:FG-GAP-like repeat-containing protein [Lacibacter sp.]